MRVFNVPHDPDRWYTVTAMSKWLVWYNEGHEGLPRVTSRIQWDLDVENGLLVEVHDGTDEV